MKVSVFIEDDYVEVSVSRYEIASVIAKHYGISAEAMYNIICDFDIDLEEEIENNDSIKELAKANYYKDKVVDE